MEERKPIKAPPGQVLSFYMEINDEGTIKFYDEERRLHRLDGPAIEWLDGTRMWCEHGLFHRLDGPAIEFFDGSKEWFVKGNLIGRSMSGFTDEDFTKWREKYDKCGDEIFHVSD
jgi:hypothetical protein